MKKIALFLFAFMLCAGQPASAADAVGIRSMTIASLERGKDLAVTVWYPALPGGEQILPGNRKLFKGTPAFANAPAAPGRRPVILMSHGSGGRIEDMGWLATGLVEAGFIVAGPNHPGTTSGDSTPADTPKIWERAQDLSTLITVLTGDPQWGALIAKDRIGVLGFSLGGAAAMEISGARANRKAYARYCDTYKTMPDCVWFAGGNGYVNGEPVVVDKLDLRKIDKERFEQSNLDRRISAAVIVDPSLAQAYDAQSLKEITIPMTIINLGRPPGIPVAVIADGLAGLIPGARYEQVDDAAHFSFLAECRDGGAKLLKSLGDTDLLCDDGGTRTRADIHAQLREMIAAAFTRQFKAGM